MRFKSTIVPAMLLAAVLCGGQAQRGYDGPLPMPPERKPDFWETRSSAPTTRKLDLPQLKKQANELAQLASGVPSEIDYLNKGLLSKDLEPNLKRIEKLSKQLRQELGE
jgi:hypothetical protein